MSELALDHNLKIAIYAATGGRKTLQIGHLIERFGASNVGIISCESGLNTIRSLVDPAFVYEANNLDELAKAYAWAKEKFPKPDQWVCVDGGSRVLMWIRDKWWSGAENALAQVINGVRPQDLPAAAKQFAVYVTKGAELNSQQIWIRVATEAERLFNAFVRLPSSSYWTFWEEKTNIDQFQKGLPWKPDTPGAGTFSAIKGAFDFIMRLVPDGERCTAQCSDQSSVYYAKHRDDWKAGIRVPDEIKDFRLDEFVMKLKGEGFGG